jgi:SAM-dependent methyltransferase
VSNLPDVETFCHMCHTLLGKNWIFAKTMPKSPHWYTLRREWRNNPLFDEIVQLIRDYGYQHKYGRTWYTKFDINDMQYWSMGAPVFETILINRALRVLSSPYDQIADVYDGCFADEESKQEDRNVIGMLPRHLGRVLDVGCGTGLLLDYLSPDQYVGIDPSRGMLAQLKQKHPRYAENVVWSKFESYFGGRYDTIVSLFGSPSYIDPQALVRVRAMLNSGGRFFFMFLKPGYRPVICDRANVELDQHFLGGEKELGGGHC